MLMFRVVVIITSINHNNNNNKLLLLFQTKHYKIYKKCLYKSCSYHVYIHKLMWKSSLPIATWIGESLNPTCIYIKKKELN